MITLFYGSGGKQGWGGVLALGKFSDYWISFVGLMGEFK